MEHTVLYLDTTFSLNMNLLLEIFLFRQMISVFRKTTNLEKFQQTELKFCIKVAETARQDPVNKMKNLVGEFDVYKANLLHNSELCLLFNVLFIFRNGYRAMDIVCVQDIPKAWR